MTRGITRVAQPLVLTLAIAAAAAVLSFRPVYEPDLGWHLAQGREDAAGHLVRSNVFSSQYADYRQHYTSWLWETASYGAWRAGGGAGVQAFQALTLAAAFGFTFLACRVRGGTLPALSVLLLGFLVIEPRAIPRPHLASFAGFAACAWLIERTVARRTATPLWLAVLVIALWSNIHVESVFGVLLIATFAVAEVIAPSALTRREAVRAAAIAAACAIALLINPYGWGIVRYTLENADLPQLLTIAEVRPPYLPFYRAFFAYLAIGAVLLLTQPRRLTLWEFAVAAVFGALGARFLRLSPTVFWVTAPMLAARLTQLTIRGVDGRAMLVTAAAASLLITRLPLWTLVGQFQVGTIFPEQFFSPGAIAFARANHLSGPLFNSNNLGGWLEWELYPAVRTFQDGRLQAYPPEHFRRIIDAAQSQPAWDALVGWVDWGMLSSPRPNALSGAGRFARSEWATVYWDEAIEIVVRRSGSFGALAADEYRFVLPDSFLNELTTQAAPEAVARIRAEARRNRQENPRGFTAAAILCIAGDADACGTVDRLAAGDPTYASDAALVRVLRRQ